jgi:TonB family protein
MTITKDGQLENVRIYESSGSEILDNAALESVKDSLPFPPIPEELEREKIELKFYLVFKIT